MSRVPSFWGAQLGGTLRTQLDHLRIALIPPDLAIKKYADMLNESEVARILARRADGKYCEKRTAIAEALGISRFSVDTVRQRAMNKRTEK